MKTIRIFFLSLFFLSLSLPTCAWGRRVHATIAYIAEQHLTDNARKKVSEILHSESMIYYSSWLDDYKSQMLIKLDEPYKGKYERTIPHTFKVDKDGKVYIQKNHECISTINDCVEQLKHSKHLNDSTRLTCLVSIIHLVGDIHCPTHILYDDKRDHHIGNYKIIFGGQETKYHAFWDTLCADSNFAGGIFDLAYIIDRASDSEIKQLTKGNVADWGNDVAESTKDKIWHIQKGDTITHTDAMNFRPLLCSQIEKAGLRLAKLLNEIFK